MLMVIPECRCRTGFVPEFNYICLVAVALEIRRKEISHILLILYSVAVVFHAAGNHSAGDGLIFLRQRPLWRTEDIHHEGHVCLAHALHKIVRLGPVKLTQTLVYALEQLRIAPFQVVIAHGRKTDCVRHAIARRRSGVYADRRIALALRLRLLCRHHKSVLGYAGIVNGVSNGKPLQIFKCAHRAVTLCADKFNIHRSRLFQALRSPAPSALRKPRGGKLRGIYNVSVHVVHISRHAVKSVKHRLVLIGNRISHGVAEHIPRQVVRRQQRQRRGAVRTECALYPHIVIIYRARCRVIVRCILRMSTHAELYLICVARCHKVAAIYVSVQKLKCYLRPLPRNGVFVRRCINIPFPRTAAVHGHKGIRLVCVVVLGHKHSCPYVVFKMNPF